MTRHLLVPFLAAMLLAACSSVDSNTEQREQKEYVTGSNIPRKDKSGITVHGRDALEEFQRSSGGPTVKGSENR